MMFEVGKLYRFRMWEPDEGGGEITEYASCRIVSVKFPLVELSGMSGGNTFVNVASIAFVSAREIE
jgi:hypothetical protein